MNAHSFVRGAEANIEALFEQLSDEKALELFPKLLHRFSGTWGFDRAINAIDDIINELDLDPDADILRVPQITARCVELSEGIWEELRTVSDPLRAALKDQRP